MREASLRSYIPFAKGTFQSLLSYRLNFFMYVLGETMAVFVAYYLWLAVFKNSGQQMINGLSIIDMFAYIFMAQVANNFVQNDASWDVSAEVREGTIAMNLIKPIRYRVVVMFRSLGEVVYNVTFVGVPITIIVLCVQYFNYGIAPNFLSLALFFVSAILGYFVNFYFNFIFGLSAFYVSNIWGMNMLKSAILQFVTGVLIPLNFFPVWIQNILYYLPFNSFIYTPVMIFLGKYQGQKLIEALLIQTIWVVIFGLLGTALWKQAVKKLTVHGG